MHVVDSREISISTTSLQAIVDCFLALHLPMYHLAPRYNFYVGKESWLAPDVTPAVYHYYDKKAWTLFHSTWPDVKCFHDAVKVLLGEHPGLAPLFTSASIKQQVDATSELWKEVVNRFYRKCPIVPVSGGTVSDFPTPEVEEGGLSPRKSYHLKRSLNSSGPRSSTIKGSMDFKRSAEPAKSPSKEPEDRTWRRSKAANAARPGKSGTPHQTTVSNSFALLTDE